MRRSTAAHILDVIYNASAQRFEAVVEFFAPAMPVPLRVPVRLPAPPSLEHQALTRALMREAQRRGIERF